MSRGQIGIFAGQAGDCDAVLTELTVARYDNACQMDPWHQLDRLHILIKLHAWIPCSLFLAAENFFTINFPSNFQSVMDYFK